MQKQIFGEVYSRHSPTHQKNVTCMKEKTPMSFQCPLITFTSVWVLSIWSLFLSLLFLFAPSVSLHPWERIRCLLSGHVSWAVGRSAWGCPQHSRTAQNRPSSWETTNEISLKWYNRTYTITTSLYFKKNDWLDCVVHACNEAFLTLNLLIVHNCGFPL